MVHHLVVRLILGICADCHIATAEAKLPKFVLERLTMHAQNLGGLRHISLCVFQAATDVAPLKLTPVLPKIRRERDFQSAFIGIRTIGGDLLRARGYFTRKISGA